jgi:hypothetical protein
VELVTAALGAVERSSPAPPVSPADVKPFTDGLPQVPVEASSGEPDSTPSALIAQYSRYVLAHHAPASERHQVQSFGAIPEDSPPYQRIHHTLEMIDQLKQRHTQLVELITAAC